MKASSLFVAVLTVAILSIAPANAERNENNHKGCSATTWPTIAVVPCLRTGKVHYSSYVECTRGATQIGWRASDAWWGCSNLGLKN